MSEENKLDKVNATLDRFAKLIEENAEQLRKDKAENREEVKRQREEDKRQREEDKRQRAEDLAKDKKRQAEWERQRAEDLAKDEKRQAEWDRQRAEDLAKEEKRQAEWDKRFANMCEQVGGQGSTIGEITEAMTVSDNIIDLVNEFEGIDVTNFAFNIRKKYRSSDSNSIRKQHEVDGLADGKEVAVVIEAKTTLTKGYVEDFIVKLARFKVAYPEHSHKDVYGAVTFIRADEQALALAERHGLFIIKTSPPDVELANNKGFMPTKVA